MLKSRKHYASASESRRHKTNITTADTAAASCSTSHRGPGCVCSTLYQLHLVIAQNDTAAGPVGPPSWPGLALARHMVEVFEELLQFDQVDAGAGAPPAGDQVKMGHGYDRRR